MVKTYGEWLVLVNSLNSLSWMVKKGRKSEAYLSGQMLETSACTTSQATSGVAVITISGSHVSTSSCRHASCQSREARQAEQRD